MASRSGEKDKSPRSPLLDHVRSTQAQALEQRTALRIRSLLDGEFGSERRAKSASPDKGMTINLSGINLRMHQPQTGSPMMDVARRSQVEAKQTEKRVGDVKGSAQTYHSSVMELQGSSSFELQGSSPFVPGRTAMVSGSILRRNITQRRSRGRSRDDGDEAPDPSLLARRPRSRSKDRRYSMESTGAAMSRSVLDFRAGNDTDAPFVTAISAPVHSFGEDRSRGSPDKREAAFGDPPALFYDDINAPPVTAMSVLNFPWRESHQISPDKREYAEDDRSEWEIISNDHNRDNSRAPASVPEYSQPEPSLFREMAQGAKLQEDWQERAVIGESRLRMGSDDGGVLQQNAALFSLGHSETSQRNDAVFTAKRMHQSFMPTKNKDEDGSNGDDSSSSSTHSMPDKWEDDVFSKRNIPSEDTNPELHKTLNKLWDYRQSVSTAMSLALDDDDMYHYDTYRALFDQTNSKMHRVLRRSLKDENKNSYLNEHIKNDDRGFGSSVPPNPSPSQERPADKSPHWRNIDSLPLINPLSSRKVKKSYKETDQSFEIFLTYQGVASPRIVNENLPTRILYSMARSYLQDEFGFRISSDLDLNLEFRGMHLSRMGILEDVPIVSGSMIMVLFPIKPPVSGESPNVPSAKFGPSYGAERSMPLDDKRFSTPGENGVELSLPPHFQLQPVPVGAGSHRGSVSMPDRPTDRVQVDGDELYDGVVINSLDPRSYDKIRQNFKCPKFSGQARDWKIWDKGFWRYLSIWELEYVLDPSFFDVIPLAIDRKRDNKLVYFIIEDAVQNSTLATSYIKQAAIGNGFEAYYTLHDGYVFAGATTATLLLNELSNFRFLPDETPTELCLRLDELFQELRDLPGDAAVTFIDTQKVGYLVNALRHEKEWDYVCSAITSAQIKGGYTFREACNELKFRCEASRANDLMDKPVKGKRVKGLVSTTVDEGDTATSNAQLAASVAGLISSMSKKVNVDKVPEKKGRRVRPMHPCLADGCNEETSFPLCPLHYHPLLSGKSTSVKLKHGYGDATYDSSSQVVVYPTKVPENRLSKKQIAGRSGTTVSAKVASTAPKVSKE